VAIGVKHILDCDDYAAIPPDGKRYEPLEGDVHVTPAPSRRHEWVSRKLQRQLVGQPDLVVVADPTQSSARGVEGPPGRAGASALSLSLWLR
jgi:hypothetical protein